MAIKTLTVEWGGKTGTINEREAFAAADAVEDHVTIFELAEMATNPRKLRAGRLAAAYAALCRHAGVPADPQEIRRELAAELGGALRGEKNALGKVQVVIGPLYTLLTDGANAGGGSSEGDTEGNEQAPAS